MGYIEIVHEGPSLDNILYQVGACTKVLQPPYDILKKVIEWCTSGELESPLHMYRGEYFSTWAL
jgi:hypothetical protein